MSSEPAEDNILCGPLLRYTYIDHSKSEWHGSALVVLKGAESPTISSSHRFGSILAGKKQKGVLLLSEKGHSIWRFAIKVSLNDADQRVDYKIKTYGPGACKREASFWVPAKDDSMRILFHSCNGFSTNVKPDSFAGPALWNDVQRIHSERAFHVMIGGGDQVYSDAVRVTGPLKAWANELDPKKRAKVPFTDPLGADIDNWYFKNYCDWYSKEPFSQCAAQIPSVQIFDDHDIIDGFGSYEDRFMRAPIFLGLGQIAWKYYMLFQQHTPPQGEKHEDHSWVIGSQTGPYIREPSRSICTSLGRRIVFYGLDCRVDRTIDRICYHSTYAAMFSRLDKEIVVGETTHLILLLGVPIAYPRLVWLESLLSTYTIAPFRLLNKVFGLGGSIFNKFDGSAELLDDLNDHWCAGTHKRERNHLVQRLQEFSEQKQVRITILSGDVHLACVGRFFSKANLAIPQNKDPRYMVNIVSSAITNAPPPTTIANILNKRNKLHHLDRHTDENLMDLFFQNPDGKPNTVNRTTLPSRNYCIITEHAGLTANDGPANGLENGDMGIAKQVKGGVDHPSALAPQNGTTRQYSLDISIRAEINPKDPDGKTTAYGFTIPALER
ncbi:hypothetical protein BD410DRAFT_886816 [Rickenella mellea]|uniref:PhoD-like phosphatase domain-containing protein n=1 Tax=Rickenella mellea TaxID=50990 RepID=A0A4Y7QDT8_9AGAM|nr:hypothetical protein BD410DRAFT_886816 [Rickenella mellea]